MCPELALKNKSDPISNIGNFCLIRPLFSSRIYKYKKRK